MARVDLPPAQQKKLLRRIEERLRLDADEVAGMCRVHPRTFRDWKRGHYRISEAALRALCASSGLEFPSVPLLPDYSGTRESGRLGALARYKLYGNPGTLEGRQKAGRLRAEWVRAHPELAKQQGAATAKEIKQPAFSPLLAEFVGILIGDGGIRSRYQVTISFNRATDLGYAKWLQRSVFRLFGLKSFILLEKKNLGGAVIISSVKLVEFLKENAGLRPGNKLHNGLDVPPWIWECRSYQIACLRGLMDTDGGPFVHRYQVNGKWYAYLKLGFCSLSDPLLKSVSRFFAEIGIHPRLARNHQVFIDRVDEAQRYYQMVGSRHQRHLELGRNYRNLL